MRKIIFILFAVFAVAHGDYRSLIKHVSDIENYVNLYRQQFLDILTGFDTKLDNLKEYYLRRLDITHFQHKMIIASIQENEDYLNPLEVLSDLSNHCVNKYRVKVPTVKYTETSILHCIAEASNQANILLNYAASTRDDFGIYLANHFEEELQNCIKKPQLLQNTISCIRNVTSVANEEAKVKQEIFDNQIDAAECTAKAYIKRNLDCIFNVLRNTHSLIAEANLKINNCIDGKDECLPCVEANTCQASMDVNVKQTTIENPFYGKNHHSGCLILKAK